MKIRQKYDIRYSICRKGNSFMISNLVLQDTVNGIKAISKCDLTIVSLDGSVIASTCDDVTVMRSDIVSFAESQADSQVSSHSMMKDCHLMRI